MKAKKNKRMNFRVDDDFLETMKNICTELNCTMTNYFEERMISSEYVIWNLKFDQNELFRALMNMNNNMNQIARSMHTLERIAKEKADLDLFCMYPDYAEMNRKYMDMRNEIKKIQKSTAKKEKALFRETNRRILLIYIEEYLREHDREYLKKLSHYSNR